MIKSRLGYDDSLDAFGVHGVGGIWGALATGLFATKAVNAAGADGLFYGNPGQFLVQLKATLVTIVWSVVADLRHPQAGRRCSWACGWASTRSGWGST